MNDLIHAFNSIWPEVEKQKISNTGIKPFLTYGEAVLELCRGKEIYRVDQPGVTYKVRGCSSHKQVVAVVITKSLCQYEIQHLPYVPTEEDMNSCCWRVES